MSPALPVANPMVQYNANLLAFILSPNCFKRESELQYASLHSHSLSLSLCRYKSKCSPDSWIETYYETCYRNFSSFAQSRPEAQRLQAINAKVCNANELALSTLALILTCTVVFARKNQNLVDLHFSIGARASRRTWARRSTNELAFMCFRHTSMFFCLN